MSGPSPVRADGPDPWVVFLRAVNVGGRFVKMPALLDAFAALGHPHARSFIQSGNVILAPGDGDGPGTDAQVAAALQRSLTDGLEPRLGFRTEAFARRARHLRDIVAQALALQDRAGPQGEVNVAFLDTVADAQAQQVLQTLRTEVDDFELGTSASELFWICRTNQSASRFSNALLERRLKLRSTMRRSTMLAQLPARL